MKIVVCIKQVPDTAEVKLDPKTNTLIREGVPSIINHDDKAGLEAALRLREQVGGTVTVVCMGPPQADVALREALAMGADEAYLLSAREFGGSDTYATATIIAAALKKIGFDLVITGRQAIDGDTAQVGPQIAEQLGVPQVSYAEELTLEDGSVVVKRQFEDQAHMLKVQLPCLVTALSELDEPRYMSTWGTVDAYEKDVTVWGSHQRVHVLRQAGQGGGHGAEGPQRRRGRGGHYGQADPAPHHLTGGTRDEQEYFRIC